MEFFTGQPEEEIQQWLRIVTTRKLPKTVSPKAIAFHPNHEFSNAYESALPEARKFIMEFGGRSDVHSGRPDEHGWCTFSGRNRRSMLIPISLLPSALVIEVAELCGQVDDIKNNVDFETPSGCESSGPIQSTLIDDLSLNIQFEPNEMASLNSLVNSLQLDLPTENPEEFDATILSTTMHENWDDDNVLSETVCSEEFNLHLQNNVHRRSTTRLASQVKIEI